MSEPLVGELATQARLVAAVDDGEAADWVADHWHSFREGLLGERNDTEFPCFFGVESVKNGDPLYTAVPSLTDKDALLTLGETLLEYLATFEDHSDRASLVTFFKPKATVRTEAQYHEHLWHILQFLHVHDPVPWPEEIPTTPDDPYWEFCFGGEPMFPTCRAPFYDTRHSRYCPIGLEITFQPRTLFENLGVTADTAAGQQAREVIHDRLGDYDGVCPHADLGDWGVEGDREWKQYMLSEDPAQFPTTCPISVSREHPKATTLCTTEDDQGSTTTHASSSPMS